MTIPQAIESVAESQGWHTMSTQDLGLLLWSLFRYYAWRWVL